MKGTRNDIRTIHHGYGRLRFWGVWIGLVLGCVVLVSAPAIAATLIRANQLSLSDTFAFTGSPAISVTNAGVFTNTQANLYVTSALNGINIGTEYSSLQGGSHQTDAISGGVSVPVGATVLGANGLAGYAATSADSASRTKANAVALYGQCRNAANNSACWGVNQVVFDAAGLTGHNMTGDELDMNLVGSPAFFKGFYLAGLNQGGTLPASATGFEIATPYKLPNGFLCGRNSCTNGVTLDGLNNTSPTSSQQIIFRGYDAGGVLHASGINGDSAGNILLLPDAGSGYSIGRNGAGIGLAGSTSGTGTLKAPAIAGAAVSTLPTAGGTLLATGNGAGNLIQTLRTAGCTTSGGASAFTGPCTTTVTWTNAFADGNYTVTCTGNGIGAGVPLLQGTTTITGASTIVQTQQATGVNASFTNIECTAIHD